MAVSKRNQNVSICRGIAIIAMVTGHVMVETRIEAWVNQFDMAMFFICAGFCMADRWLAEPLKFVYRKMKGLWLPFVVWVSIFVLLHNLFISCGIIGIDSEWRGHHQHLYAMSEIFHYIGRAFLMQNSELLLGGFWFLRDFLLASIGGYFIIRFYRCCSGANKVGLFMIALSLVLLAIVLNFLPNIWLLSRLRRPSIGLAFFVSGYWVHWGAFRFGAWRYAQGRYRMLWIVVVSVAFFISGGGMSLSCPVPNAVTSFFIASFTGCFLVWELSLIIKKYGVHIANLIAYAGDHSMSILTLHLLSFKVYSALLLGFGVSGSIADFPVLHQLPSSLKLGYVVVGVVAPLLAVRVNVAVTNRLRMRRG